MLYSVLLMLDSGIDSNCIKYNSNVNEDLSRAISYFFVVETVIRVIAAGFFMTKHSYLRDGFNVFDFTLVVTVIFQGVIEVS